MTEYFCVISGEMPPEMQTNLRKFFAEVIPLPPDVDLAGPVQCHPDMIFAVLSNRLYISARYFRENSSVIGRIAQLGGFDVHPADIVRNERYPNDVAFNAAVWRNVLICRPDAVCAALLDFAKERGYRTVPVKQGYTGCSCLVTDDAVLTFDRGIAKSLDSAEIPCVRLNEGGITLPGYGCGFLGGAGGYHDGTVYLCGNADTLPCAEDIRRNGCSIVSLSENPVTDCGGIKIFKKM